MTPAHPASPLGAIPTEEQRQREQLTDVLAWLEDADRTVAREQDVARLRNNARIYIGHAKVCAIRALDLGPLTSAPAVPPRGAPSETHPAGSPSEYAAELVSNALSSAEQAYDVWMHDGSSQAELHHVRTLADADRAELMSYLADLERRALTAELSVPPPSGAGASETEEEDYADVLQGEVDRLKEWQRGVCEALAGVIWDGESRGPIFPDIAIAVIADLATRAPASAAPSPAPRPWCNARWGEGCESQSLMGTGDAHRCGYGKDHPGDCICACGSHHQLAAPSEDARLLDELEDAVEHGDITLSALVPNSDPAVYWCGSDENDGHSLREAIRKMLAARASSPEAPRAK